AFVLEQLEKRNLPPAPEADKRTLARRVSFDLTGLPPTPEEVSAFVNDPSPQAYETYVDKLLASPHWGEHRGRYWLDYSRYADTHGIHFDNYREMWFYRDWVIKAFNQNMPFDQFTREQLAGDLLPDASLDQKIATGFQRNNITTNEGGAIDEEYIVLYARDRTETFGQVFFGMTTGCAVCHDHKYDPFSMRDFYSLSAFFNNTTQRAMDGNIKDTPPTVVVPADADRPRWPVLQRELVELQEKLITRRTAARPDFDNWLKEHQKKGYLFARQLPKDQLQFQALLAEGAGFHITALVEGQLQQAGTDVALTWEPGILAEKAWKTQEVDLAFPEVGDFEQDQPFSVALWAKVGEGGQAALLSRMDEKQSYRGWDIWVENGRVGTHIVHQWMDNALKVLSEKPVPMNTWVHLAVTYDGSSKAKGVRIYINGEEQKKQKPQVDKLNGTIKTEVPMKIGKRNTSSRVTNSALQDVRLYSKVVSPSEVKTLFEASRVAWLVNKANP
ncbi:MAG TPA: DUF1549 domain-containing protein, partial [Gemmatales bacterium]|nr:DUF1549 domain-containing protein [Gemmatales bacterium]